MRNDAYTHFYLDGFFDPSLDGFADDPFLREGIGRKTLYENIPVFIEPQHTIVGQLDRGLNQEIVTCWVNTNERHGERLEKLINDPGIDATVKQSVQKNFERMKAYAHYENLQALADPPELLVSESGAAQAQWYNGHMVLDYEHLLSRGIAGIMEDVRTYEKSSERKSFYRSLRLTVEGMQRYILRHAEYAEKIMQDNEASNYDYGRLSVIAQVCRNIAQSPPSSFHEAVQLQWFFMMFGDYDSFGRFDQYMYPHYKNDRNLKREEAKAILMDMLTRLDDNGNIINMTIGGITKDGCDAVNELTYLIMETVREAGFKGPNLCLRITAKSDDRLWKEAIESLSKGQALPALYNDDIFLPMLKRQGIEEADANNYSLAGCSQAVIPGKSNFACDMGLYTPAKILELALHNGFDPILKKQIGPMSGDAENFSSFEEVYGAYVKQMKYCVEKGVLLNDQDMALRRKHLSCVRTLLTSACLQKGLSIFEGGADYNGIQGEVVGITNTANALTAIQELVFEKNEYTMAEIIDALDHNFEGCEAMRKRCLEASKFGNDLEKADQMRVCVATDIFREISSYKTALGGVHWPGEVIFSYHISQAEYVGALPDGRKSFEPLADSAGASQGTDMQGLTALLNSCTKLPVEVSPFTSINVNLKFDRRVFNENREKIEILFKTYFAMNGCQLQVNVLNRDDLLDALNHPEKHRSLVVRVGGFSAYFVHLERALQEEIIRRSEVLV